MLHKNILITLFAFLSLSLVGQKTAKIQVETPMDGTPSTMGETAYSEAHRPQFHFSPSSGWMNDPNGMVFYDGEYHLFYQYYPYATVWGPMHWGHAVSKDLVHWEHLPIALYPDSLGMIFSGSAVVDQQNTSGFKNGEEDPLVAIYTYHNMTGEKTGQKDFQNQAIAYSLDKGRSWTKYPHNPVVKNPGLRDFRDPKVFWHEQSQQWTMIFAAQDSVKIYQSPNLKNWTLASNFGAKQGSHGGVWECPDLFPLAVDGDPDQVKWVMIVSIGSGGPNGGSGTQYFIGDFDGKTFVNDNPKESILWLDSGKDNYAGVTWSDIPEKDGRRLFIGWMSNWEYANKVPTDNWRSAMTLPRNLSLKTTDKGIRLISQPVEELKQLRTKSSELKAAIISSDHKNEHILGLDPSQMEVELVFDLKATTSKSFGIELSNSQNEIIRISYEKVSNLIIIDRSRSGQSEFSSAFAGLHFVPRTSEAAELKLHVFFDQSSFELFADDGSTVITDIFFPTENFDQIRLFAFDGVAKLVGGKAYQIESIWR